MAKGIDTTDAQQETMSTIEELAAKLNVPDWAFAGMKVSYAWGAGKELTEKEFLEARDKWLSGPMDKGVK